MFSIYRRTSEMPLYRIEKDPKLARRQGAYAVVAATGVVLKRGTDLARVLAVLEEAPARGVTARPGEPRTRPSKKKAPASAGAFCFVRSVDRLVFRLPIRRGATGRC